MLEFLNLNLNRKKKKREPTAYEQLRGSILANEDLSIVGTGVAASDYESPPWSHFAEANRLASRGAAPAIVQLRKILALPRLESRIYLQTWHCLRALGVVPPEAVRTEVVGVVVEMGLKTGLDAVVAYADCTARYFNHSGAAVIWDTQTTEMNASIDPLLHAAETIGESTAPVEEPHPPPPRRGSLLINILTPGGIHIGMGKTKAMQSDPMGAAVTQAALALMQKLMKLEAAEGR